MKHIAVLARTSRTRTHRLGAWLFVFLGTSVWPATSSLRGSGYSSEGSHLIIGRARAVKGTTPVLGLINRFKDFAKRNREAVTHRHNEEARWLESGTRQNIDTSTRLVLQDTVRSNLRAQTQTGHLYDAMIDFSDSMEKLLYATAESGNACKETRCGDHASCTDTTRGPQCICDEGYVGRGNDCRAPAQFMPQKLIRDGYTGYHTRAADISVNIFSNDKVAVVFRDVSKGNKGVIVLGSVREAGIIDFSPPDMFTSFDEKAFDPVVAGTASKRILVVWRDENLRGKCWMRSAEVGALGIRGAELHKTWGQPVSFCNEQSHKMAVVPLPQSRLAVLFADHLPEALGKPAAFFGNSFLVQVQPKGVVAGLGKFRFSDSSVCRIEVTKVSPTSFVLGVRASKWEDNLESKVATKQEAMAMYGEVMDNELIFNPNPVNLEPTASHIWARGLSVIAPGTVAYAYQAGESKQIKMAVINVDPTTHRLKVAQKPAMVHSGFSPYVGMTSVPYTPNDPHTLIYYEAQNMSWVSICSWTASTNSAERCEDFPWLSVRTSGVSGARLGGGKNLMAFTTESGTPYYGVFGLSKKGLSMQ